MDMAPLDFTLVRHALNLAKNTGMDEVELELGDFKFSAVLDEKVKKTPISSAKPSANTKVDEVAVPSKAIKSLNVGIFREPAQPLKVGDEVQVGDVVGSVVALGISNDIVSSVQGRITEVNVFDSEPVEYGQVLAMVEAE